MWTSNHPPYTLAVPLIQAVYESSPVGGCLHIVVDDLNVDRESVDWCRKYTGHWHGGRGPICKTCDDCAKVLQLLSKTARNKAIATYDAEARRALSKERTESSK